MIIQDPIYGQIKIEEPVLLELIASPAMQRLSGIDQEFTRKIKKAWGDNYTRLDHSIGVMHLIQRFGGSLEEQIAALLHDVSHTAFSHTMDFVFGTEEKADFHEQQIERIIFNSNVPEILKKFGYDTYRIIDPKNFSLLEQEIPAICADRIDYSLRTFYNRGLCPIEQTKELLNDLVNYQGKFTFQTEQSAYKFGALFLEAELRIWDGNGDDNVRQILFAKLIKIALERGEVSMEDFFSTDEEFFRKLGSNTQSGVMQILKVETKIVNPHEEYDYHTRGKIRYVDPPVMVENSVKNLSELNPEFKKELEAVLKKRRAGNYVKILNKEILNT